MSPTQTFALLALVALSLSACAGALPGLTAADPRPAADEECGLAAAAAAAETEVARAGYRAQLRAAQDARRAAAAAAATARPPGRPPDGGIQAGGGGGGY